MDLVVEVHKHTNIKPSWTSLVNKGQFLQSLQTCIDPGGKNLQKYIINMVLLFSACFIHPPSEKKNLKFNRKYSEVSRSASIGSLAELVVHVTRPVILSKTEAKVALTGGMNPLSDASAGIKITWHLTARESFRVLICTRYAQRNFLMNLTHCWEEERLGYVSTVKLNKWMRKC